MYLPFCCWFRIILLPEVLNGAHYTGVIEKYISGISRQLNISDSFLPYILRAIVCIKVAFILRLLYYSLHNFSDVYHVIFILFAHMFLSYSGVT